MPNNFKSIIETTNLLRNIADILERQPELVTEIEKEIIQNNEYTIKTPILLRNIADILE